MNFKSKSHKQNIKLNINVSSVLVSIYKIESLETNIELNKKIKRLNI